MNKKVKLLFVDSSYLCNPDFDLTFSVLMLYSYVSVDSRELVYSEFMNHINLIGVCGMK